MDAVDRRSYIGASDAAAVLGLSRWGSPLSVWADKTGKVNPEDISDKLQVWLGNEFEETVAKLFTKTTGKKVHQELDETGGQVLSWLPGYPFLACHVDRWLDDEDAILQCKTASPRKGHEWDDDEIPVEYIIQEQHELMVTGRKIAYIAVLLGNERFVWKKIARDETIIKEIFAREVYFWNEFVLPQLPPDKVMPGDRDTLTLLFPTAAKGKKIELLPPAEVIASGIKDLELERDRMENIIDQQKNELRLLLSDAEEAESEKYRVTWKNSGRASLDADRMKIEDYDLYEKYLKKGTTRQLRIYKKTGGKNGNE